MTTLIPRPMLAALLAASAAACGHPSGGAPQPAPQASASTAPGTPSDATAARVRADSLRRPYTDADVRFMSDMIGHHAQALVMAAWAPTHGAEPSIRILAERIINAQQDEIATMQHWLGDRGQPVPGGTGGMSHPMSHEGHDMAMPGMLMPGMLTAAQMASLDSARGPTFDHLFLTGMIQHHRGAVTMVQQLFDTPGAARDETVFKFANDVNADQSTEIARMQTMLAALTSERSSP
jgi:uncharacterized protein (DUF305 family)